MSSRDNILKKLRQAQQPFKDIEPIEERLPMTPLGDKSIESLKPLFIEQAERLKCYVWQVNDDEEAIEKIIELIGNEKQFIGWDFSHIPIHGLEDALTTAGIHVGEHHNASINIGLTGVDAALASTGSIVIRSGVGKPRTASLLPYSHIAVVRDSDILPDLETWITHQQEKGLDQFRATSNTVIISGASRTADIAMELVLGAHGPADLHLVMLP